jgi:hypothetical protein
VRRHQGQPGVSEGVTDMLQIYLLQFLIDSGFLHYLNTQ